MYKWNWRAIGLGLLATTALLFFPITRRIIVFILPLGSGIDDLLFMIVFAITLVVAFATGWISWDKTQDLIFLRKSKPEIRQAVSAVIGFCVFALTPTGSAIVSSLLIGTDFELLSPDTITHILISVLAGAMAYILFQTSKKEKKESENSK
jgi:hypothetical protein